MSEPVRIADTANSNGGQAECGQERSIAPCGAMSAFLEF